jgi:hypothetical protein
MMLLMKGNTTPAPVLAEQTRKALELALVTEQALPLGSLRTVETRLPVL